MGAVDEANAALGLLRLQTAQEPEADAMLARMQNEGIVETSRNEIRILDRERMLSLFAD